ncbi:MAG TPA: hypothetical protein VK074_12260 [Fodinibius sp.]|nr:hypothetical protein [Fodinibius sp.]
MPKVSIIFLVALAASVSFAGCTSGNRDVIDKAYVESGTYDSFSKQVQNEQEASHRQEEGLRDRLKRLHGCSLSLSQSLAAPFTIDSLTIAEWNRSEDHCSGDQSFRKHPITLKVTAETRFEDVKLLWILRSRTSIYQNQELVIAAYGEEKLLSAERVGVYRKNLKEKISTDIEVTPGDEKLKIVAVERRDITYPIEQVNAVENVYHIDRKGYMD